MAEKLKEIDICIELCKSEGKNSDNYWENIKKLMSWCKDPNLPFYIRSKTLFNLYSFDKEIAIEILISIRDMIDFSSGSVLDNHRKVLEKVIIQPIFESEQRYQTCLSFYNSGFIEYCYEYFTELMKDEAVLMEFRVECCKFLFYSQLECHVKSSLYFLKEVIQDVMLSSKFRYETIACFITTTGVSTRYNVDNLQIEYDEEYVYPLQSIFFFEKRNNIRERLLSGQHILQMEYPDEKTKKEVSQIILEVCEDKNEEHDIRADAADILLRLCPDAQIKEKCGLVMQELGDEDNKNEMDRTFYSDKQNVHKIQESVDNFIENMIIYESKKSVSPFNKVHDEVNTIIQNNSKLSSAERYSALRSLTRISIDTAKFTKLNLPSSVIFCYVWQKIKDSSYDEETGIGPEQLTQRLIEELVDMADTCSTGHCNRLVNVFGEAVRMDIVDQLESNIVARLNNAIKNIEDEELKGDVVCGMSSDSDENERKSFLSFVDSYKNKLYVELHNEFVSGNFMKNNQFIKIFNEKIKKIKT